MKIYKKVHESEEIANQHITKIKKRGGNVKKSVKNGKTLLTYSFEDASYESNLTPRQQQIVRTPEFKAWFGDWENDPKNASKVVDENGEPLVVYHRAKMKFYQFDKNKQLNGWIGKGFYFSPNKDEFKEYGKAILGVFINSRNLFKLKGNAPSDVISEVKPIHKNNSFDENDISNTLKQNGYDGVKFGHWDRGIIISCFEPNQIKLADGTNTKFSSISDDIRL